MRLTGVQLDGCFASHTLIDFCIDFQQTISTDILHKKHLGFAVFCCESATNIKTTYSSAQREGTNL